MISNINGFRFDFSSLHGGGWCGQAPLIHYILFNHLLEYLTVIGKCEIKNIKEQYCGIICDHPNHI
jgi:hypothetical protein